LRPGYYQRALGELALAALPPQLRELSSTQLARRLKAGAGKPRDVSAGNAAGKSPDFIALSDQQTLALAEFESKPGPFLLFGATGSGKTEVYLHAVAALLERDPGAQALVMVPEINLTPQLEARFNARFAPRYGDRSVVSLHSGMTHPQRLKSWLAAHSGAARIVLGTRMAVFASMPGLKLIVVDEEHDPSYKQQEGARYSARDLAVYRGRLDGAKVLLGSATPSLESWHHSRPATVDDPGGRYTRLVMPGRIGDAGFPKVRRVDMNHQPMKTVFSAPLLDAIRARVARGEQSMVFLNRRGYAPVLHCADCGWKSECPHCSAFRVFHKIDRTLRCHHCGFTERVPRACPACGNIDIAPLGRGTERLEEHLAELLEGVTRPDGTPIRIVRIDADTTKLKGALESQLAQVHSGEVDVLVGTQMIAKGHDFRRITLVAAVNPDGALFSSDFRAPERLFSLLMQSAGRAGRDAALVAASDSASEMWIQTFHPAHPLFEALKKHDYPAFAARELQERQAAAMPPFSFQALVRAEARTQEVAQGFPERGEHWRAGHAGRPGRLRGGDGAHHPVWRGAHDRATRGQRGARADAGGKRLARRAAALSGRLAGDPAPDADRSGAQRPDPLGHRRGPADDLTGPTVPPKRLRSPSPAPVPRLVDRSRARRTRCRGQNCAPCAEFPTVSWGRAGHGCPARQLHKARAGPLHLSGRRSRCWAPRPGSC
jgi:primosomal protein N' (replication factor Y)